MINGGTLTFTASGTEMISHGSAGLKQTVGGTVTYHQLPLPLTPLLRATMAAARAPRLPLGAKCFC